MKTLGKLRINEFVEMTDKEMKFIVGGGNLTTCTYAGKSISCYGSCSDIRGTDGVVCGVSCSGSGGGSGGGKIESGCKY